MRVALLTAALALLGLSGPAIAQLAPVDGVLLLRSQAPDACLEMADGAPDDAELYDVLMKVEETLDTSTPLRAIAFDWAEVGEAAELLGTMSRVANGAIDDDALDEAIGAQTEGSPDLPAPSIVAFPDARVVSDIAACPDAPVEAAAAPPLPPTGRAWLLSLAPSPDAAVDRRFILPNDFAHWLQDLETSQEADGPDGGVALCVLLEGALARQPIYARRLLDTTLDALEDALDDTPHSYGISLHAAPGVIHPFALRLRTRDAVLVGDIVPERERGGGAAAPDCATLVARTLDTSPVRPLGPDLRAATYGPGDDCRAPFEPGEQRHVSMHFEFARFEPEDNVKEDAVDALDCVANRLMESDEDLRLDVAIEGYSSLTNGTDGANGRYFSSKRAAAMADLVRARLSTSGRCDSDSCERLSVTAAGFGGTGLFADTAERNNSRGAANPEAGANQIAWARVTAVTDTDMPTAPLDGAVSRRFLAEPGSINGACAPRRLPILRGRDVVTFFNSRLGRELSEVTNPPEMILLLHNQTGGSQQLLTEELDSALDAQRGVCTVPEAARIGYLYRHEAPILPSGGDLDNAYYLLPPKFVWIYQRTADFSKLEEVAETYGITSRNNVSFSRWADNEAYRRPLIGLIDTLEIGAPVPLTEVLRALEGTGTGWVDLDGTWD